jgi:hypothetical protein
MFLEAFEEDFPTLIKNGVQQEELPLLLDFLLFQSE